MILAGDCIEQMKTLQADSVDAIVTDPPYGLEFMGKEWDGFGTPLGFQTWTEQWAREALRVLKPGGHLLAFGGTRMYHRLAAGIEDAGFEIRDTLMWLYGSGFPKSLDVSKAIDKRGGESVGWFGEWFKHWRTKNAITQKEVAALFPSKSGNLTGCVSNWELGVNLPTAQQFTRICEHFNLPFNSIEEAEREVIGVRDGNLLAVAPGQNNDRSATALNITAPSTEAAKKWEGWGTALKPAVEPIVLARKPLIGTVAENVLTHGTGALNIDASRIGTEKRALLDARNTVTPSQFGSMGGSKAIGETNLGRWPANILLDEAAAALLDEQSGVSKSAKTLASDDRERAAVFGGGDDKGGIHTPRNSHTDTGGASRFFYVAKASRAERNKGLEGFTERYVERDNGFSAKISDAKVPRANIHPTVKPVQLMRYLIRLVTPKGGTVLDPFLGSGTTAVAAIEEGVAWIGCEREPEYLDIIRARVAAAQPGLGLTLNEPQE